MIKNNGKNHIALFCAKIELDGKNLESIGIKAKYKLTERINGRSKNRALF